MTRILKIRFEYLVFLFVTLGVVFAFQAFALSKADIVFPVKELGGCTNEAGCKSYCSDSKNVEACVTFAEKYSLMSQSEIEHAKKFIKAGKKGPGGCNSKESCESYCNDISHMDECLLYAEKNGMMPQAELEEAKKVQAALKKGAELPGGCASKASCDTYCNDPNHMEECIIFAEAAGFMPAEERDEARKVLQAIKKGAKPPPCRGKRECDTYCMEPENLESCLSFAEVAGLIAPEELKEAKQFLSVIKKGVKPPKCRGRAECDEYCSQPGNLEECLVFAEAAGFMSSEEAAMARKTGGKGPGGCRGKEECERFCEDPENQDVCFQFAVEHDLLSEEDREQIEEGKAQFQEALDGASPEVLECLESNLGQGILEEIQAGTVMPNPGMGDVMRRCFEQFMGGPGGGFGPGDEGDFEDGEEFDEFGEEEMPTRRGAPSVDDVMRQLPPNLPDSVLECVESQLSEDVIRGGESGVRSLVEQCFVEEQGGNIFDKAKRFFKKLIRRP